MVIDKNKNFEIQVEYLTNKGNFITPPANLTGDKVENVVNDIQRLAIEPKMVTVYNETNVTILTKEIVKSSVINIHLKEIK